MSVPSFRLNRVFHPLLEGVRSTRLGEVEVVIFAASPFRSENEMTGTDRPSAKSAVTMTGTGYRMVSVGVSFRCPLAFVCSVACDRP
jgi:hypothetical protein